jgi:hypothetical protein
MELFSVYQLRGTRRAQSLFCVWLETGNARQPLACIWIDPAAATGANNSGREAAASGEDHLGRLVA